MRTDHLRILRFGLLPLLLCATHVFVYGDTVEPPCTYQELSKDEKYVFVMIAPESTKEVECNGSPLEKKAEAAKIRRRFVSSGLYANKNRGKPLWQVDWFSHQVLVANDGKHVVRTGPWATKGSDEALSLIKDGRIIKTYYVGDLVDIIDALRHSVSHFEWKKQLTLNDDDGTLSVKTLDDKSFLFSLDTGEILDRDRHSRARRVR